MSSPVLFSTPCGHQCTVTPVRSLGGPFEGMWRVLIRGPGITTKSGVKLLYTNPCVPAAVSKIALFLHIPESHVRVHLGSNNFPFPPQVASLAAAASLLPTARPAAEPSLPMQISAAALLSAVTADRPFDKFELAPNGKAHCRICKFRIRKRSERVGLQNWNQRHSHWEVLYFHRECCSEAMLRSLYLPGSKRSWEEAFMSINSRLDADLQRQEDERTARRRLVYGERGDLRESLRQMRLVFASEMECEPHSVFGDDTLDEVVARLPSDSMELMRVHGIAKKRCDHFGGAILQLIAQYQQTHEAFPPEDTDDAEVQGKNQYMTIEEIVAQNLRDAEANEFNEDEANERLSEIQERIPTISTSEGQA